MNNDTNRDDQTQADLSKSQSAQQPRGEADKARDNQLDDSETGESNIADYGSAERADAITQNRSGVEQSAASNQKQGGFVGSDSQDDTSSELVDSEKSPPPTGK